MVHWRRRSYSRSFTPPPRISKEKYPTASLAEINKIVLNILAQKLESIQDDDIFMRSKSSKHKSTHSEEDNNIEEDDNTEESNTDWDFDTEIILGKDKDNSSQDVQGDTWTHIQILFSCFSMCCCHGFFLGNSVRFKGCTFSFIAVIGCVNCLYSLFLSVLI